MSLLCLLILPGVLAGIVALAFAVVGEIRPEW